jgi:1,4-dihydroxy-6-naphthoate synthase
MEKILTLGYSPCPNDTFIFHALTHGKLPGQGISFQETLEDVETLNRMTIRGELDVSKVSYHALGFLREDYCLLRAGGALGRGCGPLIVTRTPLKPEDLRGRMIAIPGMLTTAYLLMQLYDPTLKNVCSMPFDKIMDSVAGGSVDAGLIIHEGRFTYQNYGLHQIADLGQWWEEATGLPIPLGCIVARRELGSKVIHEVDELIRASLLHARKHPEESASYIKSHAQELEDQVIRQHIELYVNDFSEDLGDEGTRAVEAFLRKAEEKDIIERSLKPLFAD